MDPRLDLVRRVYDRWGRHPWVYAAQDPITFLGRHRTIRRRAAEATEVGRGDRVLEVGCGTGRNLRYLEELVGPEGRILGFDYTPAMLTSAERLCQRHGWENVDLVQGDAAELAVEGPFDGALSVLAMSVVPEHERALARIHDLLRPGGWLAICDATPFDHRFRLLNRPMRAIFVPTTRWVPDRDLPAAMRQVFGNVEVERFNGGSMFVARSERR